MRGFPFPFPLLIMDHEWNGDRSDIFHVSPYDKCGLYTVDIDPLFSFLLQRDVLRKVDEFHHVHGKDVLLSTSSYQHSF